MRIAIVDDHSLFRLGLETALGTEPDLQVAWSAGSADDALAMQRREPAECIVVDLNLGRGTDGIELTRRLRAMMMAPTVVILTAFADLRVAAAAQSVGAAALIPKAIAVGEVADTLRRVHAAPPGTFLAPRPTQIGDGPWGLSARESDVLELIRLGCTNREIARRLAISVPTVNKHVHNIFQKLHVKNRAEAVHIATSGLGLHLLSRD